MTVSKEAAYFLGSRGQKYRPFIFPTGRNTLIHFIFSEAIQ